MSRPDSPPEEPPPTIVQYLCDPRHGGPALEVAEPAPETLARPHRTNCFTIYRVRAGTGSFWADAACHPFAAPCLLFFVPYPAVRLAPDADLLVTAVRFHANFLCIERHHHEVGCNGVLFNDPYGAPVVALREPAEKDVSDLIGRIRDELTGTGLARRDAPVVPEDLARPGDAAQAGPAGLLLRHR